jgi:GT2 family glycosyltransferase
VQAEARQISAVVATRNRADSLYKTLISLSGQETQPWEIIIVDASDGEETHELCEKGIVNLRSQIRWIHASVTGAASQRHQGVMIATQPLLWFFDDDILFEQNCVERLWNALEQDRQLGGVNAMIINQRYHSPGFVSRTMFTLMHGRREKSFAGKVIGPAINLLPEDRDDLPEVVPVEWLNTTCTMYRREVLPTPVFDEVFTGYSLMEDLALSLRVAQAGWKLANARTARVVHDSQPGDYKSDVAAVASMEFQNRYYVMTNILHRRSFSDHVRLMIWELFSIASGCVSKRGIRNLAPVLLGKWNALRALGAARKNDFRA